MVSCRAVCWHFFFTSWLLVSNECEICIYRKKRGAVALVYFLSMVDQKWLKNETAENLKKDIGALKCGEAAARTVSTILKKKLNSACPDEHVQRFSEKNFKTSEFHWVLSKKICLNFQKSFLRVQRNILGIFCSKILQLAEPELSNHRRKK